MERGLKTLNKQTNEPTSENQTASLRIKGEPPDTEARQQDGVFERVCVCAGVSVCVFSSDRNRKIQAPVVPQKLAKLKALCC